MASTMTLYKRSYLLVVPVLVHMFLAKGNLLQ